MDKRKPFESPEKERQTEEKSNKDDPESYQGLNLFLQGLGIF
jgi:hypothetical protein